MRKFDYSFLNNGMLPVNMVTLTANIASLKTMAGVRKEEYGNVILEIDKNGIRKVRFRPVSAKETSLAMEQLEIAYMD